MADQREYASFDDVRTRLDEIVDAVSAEGISLDDALALYEEAVRAENMLWQKEKYYTDLSLRYLKQLL